MQKSSGRLSYADFLEYAGSRDGNFEYVDGDVLDMGIPSDAHQDMVLRLGIVLEAHLRGGACRVRVNPRLWTGQQERCPDVLVRCRAAGTDRDEPRLVIEILSPNRGDDLTRKLDEYQAMASIAEYVVIDSTRRWARRYTRDPGGFFIFEHDTIGGVLPLDALDCVLDLDDLFATAGL